MPVAEFLNTEGEHEHDTSVSSLSIIEDSELDFGLLQDWIGELIQKKGTDLYRMKGVLNIKHGATLAQRTPLRVGSLSARAAHASLSVFAGSQRTKSMCTTQCT